MEILNKIPNEIQFNVIKFLRNPVAEIILSVDFRYERDKLFFKILKRNRLYGSAFDRGKADAYYGRDWEPHKWIIQIDQSPIRDIDISEEEMKEYKIGYGFEEDRKSPTYC